MNNFSHKVSDITAALNLSARRVQQLVKEEILPTPKSGNYDLRACITAYEDYSKVKQMNIGKIDSKYYSTNDSLAAEKLRLLKAQAAKAELEVQIMEGKFIDSKEVELHWSNLIIAFRAKMLNLPNNLARQIMALNNDFAAIVTCLEEEIHRALLELSNYDSQQSLKEDSTATKADR